MQSRFILMLVSSLLAILVTSCGKKSGSGRGEGSPQKPSLTTPGIPAGEGSVMQPGEVGPGGSGLSEPEAPKPKLPSGGEGGPGTEVKPTPSVDKFANALKGLWGLAIAQKPRACSSIYDFRDIRSLSIHVLCPGDKGRTISLQTESFARISDDGRTALLRRVSSTCGVSPTAAGSVFISYTLDASRRLILSEGVKSSPTLDSLSEANYAADLRTASGVHGRTLVRGCFRSGNLQNFEATRSVR